MESIKIKSMEDAEEAFKKMKRSFKERSPGDDFEFSLYCGRLYWVFEAQYWRRMTFVAYVVAVIAVVWR